MNVATYTVVEVELQCPSCAMTHEAPSKRLYWTTDELTAAKEVQECFHCSDRFRIPKRLRPAA